MSDQLSAAVRPARFIGLDLHKHYLVAIGVNADLEQVLGPQRVLLADLDAWCAQHLTPQDALALETTTNTWEVYDELLPHVHSVTVVHPPHVALITRAQVMTDKRAAYHLARLLAAGLLPPVWVPEPAVRDRRALVAQRTKLVRLNVQAKNRLHSVLHRHHLAPPQDAGALFAPERLAWWLALPVSAIERVRIQCDWDTLAFARRQIAALDDAIAAEAAQEPRITLLLQLPGFALTTALTVLAAIDDIRRFPDARHLVGYAGMGTRVHDSGLTSRSGGITKAGRRELRAALVEAAQAAVNSHPHWRAELARLEPRLGRNKAIVAIARKLLVAVWHVLTRECADRFADPERVARKLMQMAYALGRANRPQGQSTAAYVREQLDRLGLGARLQSIAWGQRTIQLPPSRLVTAAGGEA
jgi:transposase